MEEVNFYEDVVDMIGTFTEKFRGSGYVLNNPLFWEMKQICPLIEVLAEENGSEAITVSINEQTKELQINLFGCDLVVDCRDENVFFQLIRLAKSFRFSKNQMEQLVVSFSFGEMWIEG